MYTAKLTDRLNDLRLRLDYVRNKFVVPRLRAGKDSLATKPSDEELLDLEIYCILAHAAFEEFIEFICTKVTSYQSKQFKLHGVASSTIVSLILYNCKQKDAKEPSVTDGSLMHSALVAALTSANSQHETTINNNHGISLMYLRRMLPSAFINIPSNPDYLSAIAKLADRRGAYAHSFTKGPRALLPVSAKDFDNTVNDVYSMCVEICKNACDIITTTNAQVDSLQRFYMLSLLNLLSTFAASK